MSNTTFIIFFATLTTLGWMATDISLPSLPAITAYFDTSITLTQMTLPAYLISLAFSPLIAGPYSDMVGRRRVLIIGLFAASVITLLCAFAPNIYMLLLGRFFQGIAYATVVSTARAMLPDRYQEAEMARIGSINGSIAPVIMSVAPMLGGFIEEVSDWRMVYFFMTAYTLLLLLLAYLKLEETNTNPRMLSMTEVLQIYRKQFRNQALIRYGMIPACMLLGAGGYITVSPYLFQFLLKLSPSEYGIVALFTGSAIVCGGFLNKYLIEFYQARSIVTCAGFLVVLAGLLLSACHVTGTVSIWIIIPICMLFFLNINLVSPNVFALAFSCIESHYGTAMAILNTLMIIGITSATAIASILPEDSLLSLAGFFGAAGVLTLLGMWSTRHLAE